MTRFRLATGPVALFGGVFLLALIVLMPLRLVLGWFDLDDSRIAAREVTGPVWYGAVHEAAIGRLALGDLGAGLSPWPLLVGRARLDLAGAATGATQRVHGALTMSRHTAGIDDMSASLPTAALFGPLPVSALDLDDVSVRFRSGRCDSAQGRVKATLGGDIAGFVLPQSLAGAARCDAGALLLPLASRPGTEQVALRIWQSGRYDAELLLKPSDAAAAQKLALVGFAPTPAGYRFVAAGKF